MRRNVAHAFFSQFGRARTNRLFGTEGDKDTEGMPLAMENTYQEWTIDQDQYLVDNQKKPIHDLAAELGRGLRGVESRIAKLRDVNTPAYARLFVKSGQDTSEEGATEKTEKLVPVKEVLRRIQWDYSLNEEDFFMMHYDRVDDTVVESRMDTPNNSIKGKEQKLAMALPEHRIVAIKYKERVVWDKASRLDRVFGSANGRGQTIDQVMATYEEWKERQEAAKEWNRKRQKDVSDQIETVLGHARFLVLKELSSTLLSNSEQSGTSGKQQVEMYVQASLQLFRDARNEETPEPPSVPVLTDLEALDLFSELVALLPNSNLRPMILLEISRTMNRQQGGKTSLQQDLPELDEDDLTETFVRGSGAGGQKINKTANRVVLIHEPTQLRVECQDTRSLQQNRKIARKRLRLKLDEYINGSQSRTSIKAEKAVNKKARSKARNKARRRKKKQASED